MSDVIVAIKCLVYNHEPYLRDCLDGFVMQQTNFPFVAIVHDDASTDNSAAIIREYEEKYPDIIKPIYEAENQYSKRDGSLGRIMNAAVDATGAKYVAMCEGDDYWTDPLKLQKQVDFMEVHSEYSITGHRYKIYNQEEQKYELDYINYLFNDQNITGVEFERQNYLDHPFLQTMTVVYRTDCFDQLFYASLPVKGDLTIFYVCLLKGKGYCFNFEGAVYRRSNCGVYAKKSWNEKHFVGFNLYSKMYIYTKDSVFFPHAISHLNHVFADAKHSITEYKSTNRKYLKEVFDFLWEIGYIGEYIKKLLKLVYWKIKYTVIKNFRRK